MITISNDLDSRKGSTQVGLVFCWNKLRSPCGYYLRWLRRLWRLLISFSHFYQIVWVQNIFVHYPGCFRRLWLLLIALGHFFQIVFQWFWRSLGLSFRTYQLIISISTGCVSVWLWEQYTNLGHIIIWAPKIESVKK